MNKEYLELKENLEKRIRLDLVENREEYPAGAEEIYCFDFGEDVSEEDEEKLITIECIIADRFKDDFAELDRIRTQIIEFIGNIENDPKEKESED